MKNSLITTSYCFQDKDSQYQGIVTKFSKNLLELDDIIEDMRKYNNKNNPLLNILGNPSLVKISVPKYNYKVYRPLTEDDYAHMTTREDDIIEKFRPRDGEIVVDVGAHH